MQRKSNIEIEKRSDVKKLLKIFHKIKNFDTTRDFLSALVPNEAKLSKNFKIIYEYEQNVIENQDKRLDEIAIRIIDNALREIDQINIGNNKKSVDKYYANKVRFIIRKGISYRMLGGNDRIYYNDSIESFNLTLKLLKEIKNEDLSNYYNLICNICLADVYRVSSDLEKSNVYIVKAQYIAMKISRKKNKNPVNLCLGYFYNQSGLVNLQKWTKQPEAFAFLQIAKNNYCNSLEYFIRLEHIKWILKSFIDLCGCLFKMYIYEVEQDLHDIDLMIKLTNKIQSNNQFTAFQQTHNILLNKAKFLLLKMDKESLNKAEKTILLTLKRSSEQEQTRSLGSETITLGEIQLSQKKIQEGIDNIKKGFNYLQTYPQVKIIAKLDLIKIIDYLILKIDYTSDDIEFIKNNLVDELSNYKNSDKVEIDSEESKFIVKDIIVFISYANDDSELFQIKEIADKLKSFPEIKEALCWEKDTKDNICEYEEEGLEKSDIMILFCSRNSQNSRAVKDEWNAMKMMKKPIIPVFIDPTYIPTSIKARQGHKFNPYHLMENVRAIYSLIIKKINDNIDPSIKEM